MWLTVFVVGLHGKVYKIHSPHYPLSAVLLYISSSRCQELFTLNIVTVGPPTTNSWPIWKIYVLVLNISASEVVQRTSR